MHFCRMLLMVTCLMPLQSVQTQAAQPSIDFATRSQIHVADDEKLTPRFNPGEFHARAFVRAAEHAGMKYITITGAVRETGNWSRFITRTLGSIRLARDRQSLSIRAAATPNGAVMNLQQIQLESK